MSIDVQQPRPYDLVGDRIAIAGVAGGAFEAGFSYRIGEGHDEVTGHFMAGDGTGGHGQFQVEANVSGAAFKSERLFVEVFHVSAKDGSELDKVVVPVILGSKLVRRYTSYLEHVVRRGETLWGIAERYYGDGKHHARLVAANPLTISDPDKIRVGDVIRVPRRA